MFSWRCPYQTSILPLRSHHSFNFLVYTNCLVRSNYSGSAVISELLLVDLSPSVTCMQYVYSPAYITKTQPSHHHYFYLVLTHLIGTVLAWRCPYQTSILLLWICQSLLQFLATQTTCIVVHIATPPLPFNTSLSLPFTLEGSASTISLVLLYHTSLWI